LEELLTGAKDTGAEAGAKDTGAKAGDKDTLPAVQVIVAKDTASELKVHDRGLQAPAATCAWIPRIRFLQDESE